MIRKILILSCIFACFFFLGIGLQKEEIKQDQLPWTVGTNAEFPPFTYIEKGEIIGFDIDIAKEVAKRAGKEIHFKDLPFDALLQDLILGHVDFVAAGMSISPERAKRVLFTKPYIQDDPLVIVSKEAKIFQLNDLVNKKIIVNEGYTADLFLTEKGFHPTRLASPSDAFIALKLNRVDAFITSKSTVRSFLEVNKDIKFSTSEIPETSETCSLVINKSRKSLLYEIQKILDDIEEDGTLQKIKTKWNL